MVLEPFLTLVNSHLRPLQSARHNVSMAFAQFHLFFAQGRSVLADRVWVEYRIYFQRDAGGKDVVPCKSNKPLRV